MQSSILFSIYPSELKTYEHTKTYSEMLTAALFMITKIRLATKMSFSTGLNKLVHPDNRILISA